MSASIPLHTALEKTHVPLLKNRNYHDVIDAHARKVTFETLVSVGYETEDATELAMSVDGSPRERLHQINARRW